MTHPNGRLTGTIKWFSNVKGWGFIEPDTPGADIFIHYTAIDGEGYKTLHEGDKVTYDLVDKGRGPQAQNVRCRACETEIT